MELQQWQGLWTERVKPQHLATLRATATVQTISNVTVEDTCIIFDKIKCETGFDWATLHIIRKDLI
jgi:hypothetical protein